MSDSRYTTHLNYSKVKPAFASICHVFGGEILRSIDPKSDPKYLMIKFDPLQIEGNTLRWPWLASFKRAGKTYFFADTNRAGHIADPYNNTQAFIHEYERYRGRKMITFRELASYQRQLQSSVGS